MAQVVDSGTLLTDTRYLHVIETLSVASSNEPRASLWRLKAVKDLFPVQRYLTAAAEKIFLDDGRVNVPVYRYYIGLEIAMDGKF